MDNLYIIPEVKLDIMKLKKSSNTFRDLQEFLISIKYEF